jgi:hypothetical protein
LRQPQQNEAHNSFSVPIFLLLLALLFMLSDQLSRFSVPRSMLESGKAIDRTAVEKATLINRRAVGLFPDPVEIRVSANYQRAYSSIDSGLNKATEKLSEVPSSPKNHMHPHGYRLTTNLVTRIHARPVRLGERGLSQKVGALWEEIRINGRRLKKRLTSLLRSVRQD